ncbi:MAG: hypothetical protein AAAB23_16980, partial [Pseudomonas sp.]
MRPWQSISEQAFIVFMGFAKRSARHRASLGHRDITPKTIPVGAAAGCDLLIFGVCTDAKSQKIAAFG